MEIKDLIRENIKSLEAYSSARDEFKAMSSEFVFIDANENPFDTGLNRYPDPQQNLVKEALSKMKGISKEQILLGNGSDEVLDLIFRVFCEPREDNVIVLPPTYGMYEVLANTNAIELVKIPLVENFQPNIKEVVKVQDAKTKVLFLCSPNNPTANSFDASSIETLLKEFNGIVVIDEAYIDFSIEDSWLGRLDEFPNLIVTQTLSKAYGLAAIRLGICYASKEIISILNKIKPPYNVNQLTQDVALKALLNRDEVNNQITAITSERNQLIKDLEKLDIVDKVYASDANFLLVKVDNANLRYEQLLNNGIVVRNRSNQMLCENCLRFTIGTKEDNEKLITTLKLI
ncbi:histidinol-phosphate transaminase [Flavobacteriaceae bacterium]|jgi:histidinol-phosphate aminotransferase|nr:histidinol-phosphate transaminase [Flavobacteriaceae bacterium]MDC1167424.1 histidinol-phosphate transaminase [Flavobacteriaceae bacterium]MDC3285115.1 histidinol-phosphate transaminase [Flavobacteriaceae bacterium]MDC3318285.1 histidinol-phosphate transaminase [Flavobacteriaceae bacterium]